MSMFGNRRRIREEGHDALAWAWLDDLVQDIRDEVSHTCPGEVVATTGDAWDRATLASRSHRAGRSR
jgi:hypothetical protein